MKVLVTGGAGYIGSHTCVELLSAGHQVVVLDNLCNSTVVALDRVRRITGRDLAFVRGDVRDVDLLDRIFADHAIDAVIHFAGLKAVGESVRDPLSYYDSNVTGSIALLQAMTKAGVRVLVFSSSATVYGVPEQVPVGELAAVAPMSPYGRTKLVIEDMLRDVASSAVTNGEGPWRIALLRYFNPVGAHESGLIGEDPNGIPNNLMPYISQVAAGRLDHLGVFGSDYPTRDGTGVRDFIHVMDLAQGHLAALAALAGSPEGPDGCMVVNLGTGRGYSVLELVRMFETVSGRPIPYVLMDRRPGDVAECYADTRRASQVLNWTAKRGLEEICRDAWRWQSTNPQGYPDQDR